MRPLLLLWLLPCALRAAPVTLCVDGNDWPPYTLARGEGRLQVLVREAAHEAGLTVRYVALPWRRCMAEVQSGALQGAVGQPATAWGRERFAFPMRDGEVDPARALVATSLVFLRPAGEAVRWDGRRVVGLRGPVLHSRGYDDAQELLQRHRLPADDGGSSTEINARKLLAGRSNLMVTYREDARRLLADPEFAQRLEVLPRPLGQYRYYLVFNLEYRREHPRTVERWWNAVRRLRSAR